MGYSADLSVDQGRVYWLTGLSGAGKTTVAGLLVARLRQAGIPAVLLDGDRLRAVLAPDAGHSTAEREKLAFTYGRLCAELASQGLAVICATISMFHAVRAWNRAHIPGYREIYLRVPLAERQRRDPKGLYARDAGAMVGAEAIEEPASPDLVIDNHDGCTPEAAAAMIWDRLIAPDGAVSPRGKQT